VSRNPKPALIWINWIKENVDYAIVILKQNARNLRGQSKVNSASLALISLKLVKILEN